MRTSRRRGAKALFTETKCECGHQNPPLTVLCESCGKPLLDDQSDAPLEMRYDGVTRRSQRPSRNMIDRVWKFFSSVKIAIILIVMTLLASIIGTLLPQESMLLNIDPAVYYKENYGWAGHLYYLLGFSHTYESWWYIGLLFMIGTSLIVCSLDRVLPLYRALNKQQIRKHPQFILRQKLAYRGTLPDAYRSHPESWMEEIRKALAKHRYRVHMDPAGTALLAEKNRFSRWGPYINHIGLIVFLAALLMRAIPGWHMDQYVAFPEGVPVRIPETNYYLLNEQFTLEVYGEEELPESMRESGSLIPKTFETKAVLYECQADCNDPSRKPVLVEVHRHHIRVNDPLSYKGLKAYQFRYEEKPELVSIRAVWMDKQTGQTYGPIHLSMQDPDPHYEAGPYTLELRAYFPEFGLNDAGQPVNLSPDPNAPAFIFLVKGPGLAEEGDIFVYFPREDDKIRFQQDLLNGKLAERFDIRVESRDDVQVSSYVSYLNIRKEKALPYILTGAFICLIGLMIGFYWQHRRIWLRIDDGELMLGGHTNKNWYSFRKECAAMLAGAGIAVDAYRLDREEIKNDRNVG